MMTENNTVDSVLIFNQPKSMSIIGKIMERLHFKKVKLFGAADYAAAVE